MSDTIDRQAAIYVIDYLLRHNDDAKRKGHSQVFINGMEDGYFMVRNHIMQLPSVQPEIIRCKDCKWYSDRERMCNDLMGFGRYWKPDDFCSYGKRRTDE